MWNPSKLKIWFLLLIACSFGDSHIPSVDEILQTTQYLLVTQQDGFTLIESNVPRGECPQVFIKPRTNHPQKTEYVGFHLVRDPNERLSPKIMVIRKISNYLNINVFSINTTNLFDDSSRRLSVFIDATDSFATRKLQNNRDRLTNSLFDSTNRMLYLDFSTDKSLAIEQFYIRNLFEADFSVTRVARITRESPIYRFDWTEDHYAGKFFYKEHVDNEISLFEVPMGAFFPSILEGESGTKVGRLFSAGALHGATGGAFFSIEKSPSDNGWLWTTSLVPASLGNGIECRNTVPVSQLPAFFKMIIIRDHDFCMLRDGPKYNRESCDAEHIDYLTSQGLLSQQNDVVKWLLVTCIVLFMLIVLLFLYIYWLRSTFVSEDDRSNLHEFETEASLFVAKQRSFPSAYQDPALLDVSVDRWN